MIFLLFNQCTPVVARTSVLALSIVGGLCHMGMSGMVIVLVPRIKQTRDAQEHNSNKFIQHSWGKKPIVFVLLVQVSVLLVTKQDLRCAFVVIYSCLSTDKGRDVPPATQDAAVLYHIICT